MVLFNSDRRRASEAANARNIQGSTILGKSAGISGYGHLTYFSVTKNRLSTYGRQLEIGKITAADWPPIQNDYHEKLGYVACDTTDWQNSAIDREVSA